MAEIMVGQQIRITEPLTVTRIGTADLEVEYPAGSINKKLNIPKRICEPILVTEIIATGASISQDKPGIDTQKEYVCSCGKIYKKPIFKALCVRRNHKPKTPVVNT